MEEILRIVKAMIIVAVVAYVLTYLATYFPAAFGGIPSELMIVALILAVPTGAKVLLDEF